MAVSQTLNGPACRSSTQPTTKRGRLAEAIGHFERACEAGDRAPKYLDALGRAHARDGRDAEAELLLAELRGLRRHRHVRPELLRSLAAEVETMRGGRGEPPVLRLSAALAPAAQRLPRLSLRCLPAAGR